MTNLIILQAIISVLVILLLYKYYQLKLFEFQDKHKKERDLTISLNSRISRLNEALIKLCHEGHSDMKRRKLLNELVKKYNQE